VDRSMVPEFLGKHVARTRSYTEGMRHCVLLLQKSKRLVYNTRERGQRGVRRIDVSNFQSI
jgi:hypothetical protein